MGAKTLTINVDMDGVIYDFVEEMRQYVEAVAYGGSRTLPTPTRWDTWHEWGITKRHFYKLMGEGVRHRNLFRYGNEIEGAYLALRKFRKDGHFIRIVTSKMLSDKQARTQAQVSVIEWLADNAIPHHAISFVGKSAEKRGYTADVVIDDKPTLAWSQLRARNILFDQPWNQDANPLNSLTRAHGWDDVVRLVDQEVALYGDA